MEGSLGNRVCADRSGQKQHQPDKDNFEPCQRKAFINQQSAAAQQNARATADPCDLQVGQKVLLSYGAYDRDRREEQAERYKKNG